MHNLGQEFIKLGDKHQAIEYYEQALEVRIAPLLTRVAGEIECKKLTELGIAYSEVARYHEAISCLNQSLQFLKSFSYPHLNIAVYFQTIGNLLFIIGENGKATEYYKKELDHTMRALSPQDDGIIARSLSNLGKSYFGLRTIYRVD